MRNSSLPAEVKPFLLQVDKALGASQLLIMGSLANCTLSKRSEILEKARVSAIKEQLQTKNVRQYLKHEKHF
jgi:hypothetical protein